MPSGRVDLVKILKFQVLAQKLAICSKSYSMQDLTKKLNFDR